MENNFSNISTLFSDLPHNDDIYLIDKKWKNKIYSILKDFENENISKIFKILHFSFYLLDFWSTNNKEQKIIVQVNASNQENSINATNKILIENTKIIFKHQNSYYNFLNKLLKNSYFFLEEISKNEIKMYSKYENKEKKFLLKLLCNILKNLNSFPEINKFHENILKFDEILDKNQIQIQQKITKKLKKKEIKTAVEEIVKKSIQEKNYEILKSFFSSFCFKKGIFREEFISEVDKQRILWNLEDLPFFNDFFSQVFFLKENFQISADFLSNILENLNSRAEKIYSKLQKVKKIQFSNFIFNFVRFFYEFDKETDFLNFIEREAAENPIAQKLSFFHTQLKEFYKIFNIQFVFNRKFFILAKKYDFLFRKIDKKIENEGKKEGNSNLFQKPDKKTTKIEKYLKIKQKIGKEKSEILKEKEKEGKTEEKGKETGKAEEETEKADQPLSQPLEKYKKKGNDCFQAKNYEKAIKNYEKSVKIEKNQVGHLNLCLSFLKLNQNKNSIKSGKRFLKNVKKLRKNYQKKEIKIFLLKIYFRIASAYFFDENFEKSFFYSFFCFYFIENKKNSLRNSEFFTILKKNAKKISENFFVNFSRDFYTEKYISPAPSSSISPSPSVFSVSKALPDFLSFLSAPKTPSGAEGNSLAEKNQTNFVFHQKNSNQTIFLILENFWELKNLKETEKNEINFYLLENSLLQGAKDFFLFSFIQKHLIFCKNPRKYLKIFLAFLFCEFLSQKEFLIFLEHANFLSENFKFIFENPEKNQFFKFQFPNEERKKLFCFFNLKQIFQFYSNFSIFTSAESLESGATVVRNPLLFNFFTDSFENSPEILFENSNELPNDLLARWNSLSLGFSLLSNQNENQFLDSFEFINFGASGEAFVQNSLCGPSASLIFHFPNFHSAEDFHFYRNLLPADFLFDFIHFDFFDFDLVSFFSFFNNVLSRSGFLFTSFPCDFIQGSFDDQFSASRTKFTKLFKKYVRIPLKYFIKLFSIFPYFTKANNEFSNLIIWSPALFLDKPDLIPLFDASSLISDSEFKDFILEEYWEIVAQHRDLTDPSSPLFDGSLPVSLNSSTFLFSLLSFSYSSAFNSCFFGIFDEILKCISDFDDPNALCICSIYHTELMNHPFISNQLQRLNDIYLLQLFNDYKLYHAFIVWNPDYIVEDFTHLILVASILERQKITELSGSELSDYLSDDASGRDLQIIDYLSFQPTMSLVSFYFPILFMEAEDPTEAPTFYLLDKTTYTPVAQALRAFPFVNKKD